MSTPALVIPRLAGVGNTTRVMRQREVRLGEDYEPHASGLYLPPSVIRARRRPIAVDLFCGVGGFSLGFLQAGFEVIAGCDNDEAATLTYLWNLGAYPVQIHYVEPGDRARLERFFEAEFKRRNKGRKQGEPEVAFTAGSAYLASRRNTGEDLPGVSHFWFGDVRKLSGRDMLKAMGLAVGELDAVIGGPPCQGFSFGGKRNVHDPRNSLVFEFARLCLELRPKTFCMENVPGITSMITPEGVPVLDALARVISDGGFGTYEAIRAALSCKPTARVYMGGGRSRNHDAADTKPADKPKHGGKRGKKAPKTAEQSAPLVVQRSLLEVSA